MARKRDKTEETASQFRPVEGLHGLGMSKAEVIRQLRISEVTL